MKKYYCPLCQSNMIKIGDSYVCTRKNCFGKITNIPTAYQNMLIRFINRNLNSDFQASTKSEAEDIITNYREIAELVYRKSL